MQWGTAKPLRLKIRVAATRGFILVGQKSRFTVRQMVAQGIKTFRIDTPKVAWSIKRKQSNKNQGFFKQIKGVESEGTPPERVVDTQIVIRIPNLPKAYALILGKSCFGFLGLLPQSELSTLAL